MVTLRLYLMPRTAFGTPLLGETLFGQLCWAIAHRKGENRLAKLLEGYAEGRPFAVVSDAFPVGYVPLPSLPAHYWQRGDGCNRKYLKKKRWLPVPALAHEAHSWQESALTDAEVATSIVHQNKMPSCVSKNNASLRLTGIVTHNTIDRSTATTGTGQFAPYMASQIWFDTAVRLYVHVVLDEKRISPDEIRQAFEDIGACGYGRDANIGLGKFEVCGNENVPTQPASRARLTLSSCSLSGESESIDAGTTFYRVKTHFGRHGAQLALSGQPFKRPILLAEGGAVVTFENTDARPFIGTGLSGVSSVQPGAVHQGYCPVMALSKLFSERQSRP